MASTRRRGASSAIAPRISAIAEAAIIAGLVKAPSNYSPTADAEAARSRAAVVLGLMVENGDITPAQAASAEPNAVALVPTPKQNSVRYFTDWVLPQLDTLIDETVEPIDVWTTLDPNMQKSADAAINANTPKGAQGALVSLDRDGAVRAMVGGRDYVSSIYNRATQAVRQPGSSFKLFVYLAALEAGHTPERHGGGLAGDDQRLEPAQQQRPLLGPDEPARRVRAVDQHRRGASWARRSASAPSPTWRSASASATEVNTHPSMVLGTSDVRLIDMTRAFASVGAEGRRGRALRHPPGDHRRRQPCSTSTAPTNRACWSRPGSPRR